MEATTVSRQSLDLSACLQHGVSACQHPLWEKVQKGFLFSCLWHSVHSKGENKESGMGQATEIMSLSLAHHTSAGELKCNLHF